MNGPIKARLATLPYREMLELSKQIYAGLPESPSEDDIALRLSELASLEDTDAVVAEQRTLHSMFTRKKQIVILPYENGFKVSVPAQNIDIYSENVRDGISQALDNLVALRVLS